MGTPFSAQCASCLWVNSDPTAARCPACGSRRLVVLSGRRAAPRCAPPPPVIRKGAVVTLDSALGPVERVVTKVYRDVVLVTREEEARAAANEHRKPAAVGFKKTDVLAQAPR